MANKKRAKDFHAEIHDMIVFGLNNREISEELGLSLAQVAVYVQRHLGGNPNYFNKKTKHKHLREKVLRDRLYLSDKDIMSKYSLSKSELKSCLTIAYKIDHLKKIRKDRRRRDTWSADEFRFLFRWSGVISRKEINKHLRRGKTEIAIKDKLSLLGLSSKNVNGLTYSQFTGLFNKKPRYFLETQAGSPGCLRWKLVPWCHIEEMIYDNYIEHSHAVTLYISAMAMFQRWVHGDNYWKSLTSTPKFSFKNKE